jgi:hypothetical protein
MISYLFLSLILFCGAFAKTGDDSIVLPKSLKQSHFTYEGTWKTKHGEIPVNGELYLSLKGNKLSVLDTSNLEWEGKTYNVKNLMLVDTKMKTKDAYVIINNKCLVSHFSKDKGTFPRFSGWKEIGNNKFEISARSRIALKQILDAKLGKALAERADKSHDFNMRLILTLKKNKISEAVLKFLMDNKQVATKSIQVNENIEGTIDAKVFSVPAVCKSPAVDQQRKTFDLQMRLLGINLNREQDTEKDEEEFQQTQGEVQESDDVDKSGSKSDEMKKEDQEEQIVDSESSNMEKDDDNDKNDDDNEKDDVEEDKLDGSSKQQQQSEEKGKLQKSGSKSELEGDQY